MKKIFVLLMAVCGCFLAKAQVEIPHKTISYNVNYRWGIVDVAIARGTVTVESYGNNFSGTLNGTSIPWEGHIICVNDTLNARMDGMNETVTYQNGWYRHPPVSLYHTDGYNPADPAYYKNIAGHGAYDASGSSMEAITVTSDMLGMYYYANAINFDQLNPGDRVVVHIDGPYSNECVINYQGQGLYNVGGSTYRTYNCTFEYSYGGGMSGYPVECKIGVSDRIPLYLSASLPVGHVEMVYDGAW